MKMEKVAGFRLLVVFLAALNSAVAEKKQVYVSDGGVLQLRPVFSKPITSVLWKLNNNLLVDWTKVPVDLEYYPNFINRTTLDTTSGHLEMRRMTKADSGQYTVDINGEIQRVSYNVKVIKEVPKPKVLVQPLSCSPESASCTLTCDGDTLGAGEVEYSWRNGGEDWNEMNKTITITKADTARVKTFSCRMKNPVSENASGAEPNPFFEVESLGIPGIVVAAIVILVLLVLSVAVMAGYCFRARLLKLFRQCIRCIAAGRASENGRTDSGKGPGKPIENVSLNTAEN